MKILFRLNPSGKFLMDFCFINLWSFENQVNLLSGGNITEKIQFFFIKSKIRKLLKKAYKLIHFDGCLDFDIIFRTLTKKSDTAWDWLLHYIIIKEVAIGEQLNISLSLDEKLNKVLSLYLEQVMENHNVSYEIFKLKIEQIKLYTQMDLLQVTSVLKK